ncbi:hypothetical protein L195_g055708 [Trifolium pratense]|uniref:Uncharacterized protein n=1 Tax=Trifolium pratense TaxID=57577 RepID=A0A2K3KMR6_TRIPR|nr:hypothetical protein L195_g055708 [Trifolium pratense]
MLAGSCKVSRELVCKVPPRMDRVRRQALVPCHCSFPQCGWEKSAPNGTADIPEIQVSVDISYVIVGVGQTIVRGERRRSLEALRNMRLQDAFGNGASGIALVTPVGSNVLRTGPEVEPL